MKTKTLILLAVSLYSFNSFADVRVSFRGTVDKTSIDQLIKQLDRTINKQKEKDDKTIVISLNSLGGDVNQAIRLVRYVRKINDEGEVTINTSLGRAQQCESACTILFTAGHERIAHIKSRFGFHSPKYISGAPKGMTKEYIEEEFRKIWLDMISEVDSVASDKIKNSGYLLDPRMRHFKAEDLYPGYVTDIVR